MTDKLEGGSKRRTGNSRASRRLTTQLSSAPSEDPLESSDDLTSSSTSISRSSKKKALGDRSTSSRDLGGHTRESSHSSEEEALAMANIKYKTKKKRSGGTLQDTPAERSSIGSSLVGGLAHTVHTMGSIAIQPAKLVYKAGAAVGGKLTEGIGYMTGHSKGSRKRGKKKEAEKVDETITKSVEDVFRPDDFDEKKYVKQLFEDKEKESVRDYVNKTFAKHKEAAARKLQVSVHENYRVFITTSKEIANLEVDMLELRNHLTAVNVTLQGLQQESYNFDKFPVRKQKRQIQGETALVRDLHWLLELPDELDILTSERLFDTAVGHIEKCRQLREKVELAQAFSVISDQLEERIQKMSDLLMKDLQNPALKKSESRTVIGYLSRLGFAKKAREIFLDTRSQKIRAEIKKLRYENNVSMSINELSRIIFSAIDSTCDDFLHCFKDRTMLSGFVVWTIQEMSNILSHFRSQIFYSPEVDNFAVVGKCFEITKDHCKALEGRGLSLIFYLQQSFHKDLVNVMRSFYKRILVQLNKQLVEEQWASNLIEIDNKKWICSESCKHLEGSCVTFVNGVVSVFSTELLPVAIRTLSGLIETYLSDLTRLMKGEELEAASDATAASPALSSGVPDLRLPEIPEMKSEPGVFGSWQFIVVGDILVGKVTSGTDGKTHDLTKLPRTEAFPDQPEAGQSHAYFSDGEHFVHLAISDRGTNKVLATVFKQLPGEKTKHEICRGPSSVAAPLTAAIPIGPTPTRGERSATLSAAQHADKQSLVMISNAVYISEYLTPTLLSQLQNLINHTIPELEDLKKRVTSKANEIKASFIGVKARDVVFNKLNWENSTYPEEAIDEENAEPSQKFLRMFEYFNRLGSDVGSLLSGPRVKPLMTQLWAEVVALLQTNPTFWARESDQASKRAMFGLGGLHQFILDIKFCRDAASTYCSEKSAEELKTMENRGIINYCLANDIKDPNIMLKPDKWFQNIIRGVILSVKLLKL